MRRWLTSDDRAGNRTERCVYVCVQLYTPFSAQKPLANQSANSAANSPVNCVQTNLGSGSGRVQHVCWTSVYFGPPCFRLTASAGGPASGAIALNDDRMGRIMNIAGGLLSRRTIFLGLALVMLALVLQPVTAPSVAQAQSDDVLVSNLGQDEWLGIGVGRSSATTQSRSGRVLHHRSKRRRPFADLGDASTVWCQRYCCPGSRYPQRRQRWSWLRGVQPGFCLCFRGPA